MTAEHPEGWTPDDGFDRDDVEMAIETARAEADDHNAEEAGGIRLACVIIEESLFR